MFKSLFKKSTTKACNHKFKTIATNRYQVPMVEQCKHCEVTREVTIESKGDSVLYSWIYSNGVQSEKLELNWHGFTWNN